jgi:hypothetical protein
MDKLASTAAIRRDVYVFLQESWCGMTERMSLLLHTQRADSASRSSLGQGDASAFKATSGPRKATLSTAKVAQTAPKVTEPRTRRRKIPQDSITGVTPCP